MHSFSRSFFFIQSNFESINTETDEYMSVNVLCCVSSRLLRGVWWTQHERSLWKRHISGHWVLGVSFWYECVAVIWRVCLVCLWVCVSLQAWGVGFCLLVWIVWARWTGVCPVSAARVDHLLFLCLERSQITGKVNTAHKSERLPVFSYHNMRGDPPLYTYARVQ